MRVSLLIISSLLLLSSCRFTGGKRVTGNGKRATEQRNISGFSRIEVSGSYDVFFTQGDEYNVRIEGDENLLEYVETEEHGDVLEISNRNGYNLRPKSGLKVFVTAPRIKQLEVSGSGNIVSRTQISSNDKIGISIGGSGNVTLNELDAPEIDTEIGGSGSISLKGKTENFHAEIGGSGEVHAFELLSESTRVEVGGSGSAEVFASKKLDVSIGGSGDVQYKGNPAVSQSKAGSGSVRKVN
jgi:hypothetical protein